MVVGCGSLGNELLKDLVLLGVQHLVLVDFDKVEQGNLSRTVLFTPADIGRYKVDAARDSLLRLNPALQVDTLCADIEHEVGLNLIAQMDIIVSCVDSRWTRFMINRHCMRTNRLWVDGGISQTEGTVRVFGSLVCNCYACNLGTQGQTELRRRMPCSNTIRRIEQLGHVPTGIIPASVIGAVMAQQVMQLLDGCNPLAGHMFSFDADTLMGQKLLLQAFDDDCVEHEQWQPLQQSSLSIDTTVKQVTTSLGKIYMRDDCFVDYIIDRRSNDKYAMMCAGRYVTEKMEQQAPLKGRITSEFYQHEYRVIDADFPYPELTLHQLGIPQSDILQIESNDSESRLMYYAII